MKRTLLLILAAATLAGCTALKPYERAALMTRVMADPLDPLEMSFEVHVHRTREAMAGAELAGGASCGCN